jgi:hypothetical protein
MEPESLHTSHDRLILARGAKSRQASERLGIVEFAHIHPTNLAPAESGSPDRVLQAAGWIGRFRSNGARFVRSIAGTLRAHPHRTADTVL